MPFSTILIQYVSVGDDTETRRLRFIIRIFAYLVDFLV